MSPPEWSPYKLDTLQFVTPRIVTLQTSHPFFLGTIPFFKSCAPAFNVFDSQGDKEGGGGGGKGKKNNKEKKKKNNKKENNKKKY